MQTTYTTIHNETLSRAHSVVEAVVEFGNKFWPIDLPASWNVVVPVVATATPTNYPPPNPPAQYRSPEKNIDDGGSGPHEYIYNRTDSVTGFAVAESVHEPPIPTAVPLDPSHLGGENLCLPRAQPCHDVHHDERSGSLVAGKFQDKAPPCQDGNCDAAMAAQVSLLEEDDGMDYALFLDIDIENDEDLLRKMDAMDKQELKLDGPKINKKQDAVPMVIDEIQAPKARNKGIGVDEKRNNIIDDKRDSVPRLIGGKRKNMKPKKENGRKKQRRSAPTTPKKKPSKAKSPQTPKAPKKKPQKAKSPQASGKTTALNLPAYIRPNDVLSARSRAFQTHPGNISLRDIVENKYQAYLKAEKTEKTKMYTGIRDAIQKKGGRFLKQGNGNVWVEVKDPGDARDIVSNKFKNKNKERKREDDKKNGKTPKKTRNTAVKRLKASNKNFKRKTEKKPGG